MKVLFLFGPNLGALGRRDPGSTARRRSAGHGGGRGPGRGARPRAAWRQSDHEGDLVGWLTVRARGVEAAVINPGALTPLLHAAARRGRGGRPPGRSRSTDEHLRPGGVPAGIPWSRRRAGPSSPGSGPAGIIWRWRRCHGFPRTESAPRRAPERPRDRRVPGDAAAQRPLPDRASPDRTASVLVAPTPACSSRTAGTRSSRATRSPDLERVTYPDVPAGVRRRGREARCARDRVRGHRGQFRQYATSPTRDGLELVPHRREVERLRWVKDARGDRDDRPGPGHHRRLLRRIIAKLAEGMTEREVALEMEHAMRRKGADGVRSRPSWRSARTPRSLTTTRVTGRSSTAT